MANPQFESSVTEALTGLPTQEAVLARLSEIRAEIEAEFLSAEMEPTPLDSGLDLPFLPTLSDEQLAQIVQVKSPRRRVQVNVRLDPSVLDWLKSKGEGHLTRINDILLNLMEAERNAAIRKQE